jgi:hypothetical protein
LNRVLQEFAKRSKAVKNCIYTIYNPSIALLFQNTSPNYRNMPSIANFLEINEEERRQGNRPECRISEELNSLLS